MHEWRNGSRVELRPLCPLGVSVQISPHVPRSMVKQQTRGV